MKKLAVAMMLAALVTPALAQDSCGQGGDTAAPFDQGTAVSPWDTSAQVTNYQVTLSPFQTGMATPFGICPLVKSSRSQDDYFSSMISAQTLSRMQMQIDGGKYQFATAAAEFGGDYNGAFGAVVNLNPASANILNVTRYNVASNSTVVGENLSQFGMGSVDETGAVMLRVDDFGTADGISGYNIFNVNMPSRNPATINAIGAAGLADSTAGSWIIVDSDTNHSPPNIGPTALFGQPYYLGTNYNSEYVYGVEGATSATTAHLGASSDQRGNLSYIAKNHPAVGGTHGMCATLVKTPGGSITDTINVWGIDSTGAIVGTPLVLTMPSTITDNATGVSVQSTSQFTAVFDHYHSTIGYRGGNGQVAMNIDPEGNLIVAGVVYHPSSMGINCPLNHIAVARVAPNGTVDWSIAAYNANVGNTAEGKPIYNNNDVMIGRLLPLDQVTGGSPMGPSMSAPMVDAAGNIWFISAVNLTHWKDGAAREYADADGALVRAVYDADTFSYDIDLVLEQGEVFAGIDSGKNWRASFLKIANSATVDSGTAWSGNISQETHLGMPVDPEWDAKDPHFLGGLILSVGLVYDTNDDGDYNDPTSSYYDNTVYADEGYNALVYIGHLGDDVSNPVDIVDVNSMAIHGTTEYGIQIYPPMQVTNRDYNCEPRYGLTENKLVIGLSDVIADASGITVTATNTSNNVVSATVALDPAGDKLIATFSPALPNAKIYTIDVAGEAVNDFQCEFVVLVGNLTNGGPQANTVNAFDKSLVIARLGGLITDPGNGPNIDIARVGPSAGIINAFDKSLVIARLGNVAD